MSIHNLKSSSPIWTKMRDTLVNKFLINYVEKWIFVSFATLRSFASDRLPPERCHVIHNGTSGVSQSTHGSRVATEKLLNPVSLGLIGTFETRKGFEVAIEAFRDLSNHPMVGKLKIFGEGTERESQRLRGLVRDFGLTDRVEFMGFIPDKAAIYRQVNLVIVPSIAFESFGYVAIESILGDILSG